MLEERYRIEIEGSFKNLIINAYDFTDFPSIEDNPQIMKIAMNALLKEGIVNTIKIMYSKILYYPSEQVNYLNDLRNSLYYLIYNKKIINFAYSQLKKNKVPLHLIGNYLGELKYILFDLIPKDPVGGYIYVTRLMRKYKAKYMEENKKEYLIFYLILREIYLELRSTKLINEFIEKYKNISRYRIGDRHFYREIFKPMILPNLVYAKLQLSIEEGYKVIDEYFIEVDEFLIPVKILEHNFRTRYLYYIIPPEYNLNPVELDLLNTVREVLEKIKYLERIKDVKDVLEFRRVMYELARSLLLDVAKEKNIKLDKSIINKLAKIIVRLTTGFGVIEVFLEDKYIEDIYINPPNEDSRIYVKHSNYGECETNILLTASEIEGWITRFRLYSGRPLDEAHPVLDTELLTEKHSARVAIVQKPFSPHGYGLAIRKHREKPWTLPLLVKFKSLSPLAASLLWFFVENGRSILIAGTRGAGKTSLLTALMISIPRKHRIITIEDTLEIPFYYFKKLGFNILSLKVRSAVAGESGELPAEAGIRTSLRLGDSALVIGEVRSKEVLALYEAMRVGAMANAVLGTIHADSPHGLFDRVVNDLGVPTTSFKATDIIVIANKLRSPDFMKELRRVIQITEVRKNWRKDPLLENAFVDLMRYNPDKDIQEPTDILLEGESEVIKSIMSRVKEWFGKFNLVWINLKLREWFIEELINLSNKYKNQEILEANFVVDAFDMFRKNIGKYNLNYEEEIKEFKNNLRNILENEIKRRFI